ERVRTAAEETLGEWDGFVRAQSSRRGEGSDDAELGLASEHYVFREAMVGGIANECAAETALGSEVFGGESDVGSIVDSAIRVSGVIAAVLREVEGDHTDADGLEKLGNEQCGNHHLTDADLAVSEAEESGGGAGEFLRKLHGG